MKKRLIILAAAMILTACNGTAATSSLSEASSVSVASAESSINMASASTGSSSVSAVSLPAKTPKEETPSKMVKYGKFISYRGLLYFTNNNDNKLYTAKPDLSDKKVLIDPFGMIVDISGDYIYYYVSNTLCRAALNGSGKTVLTNDFYGSIQYTDQWIYYNNYNEDLLRLSKINGKIETLGSKKIFVYANDNNSVFIMNYDEKKLYSLPDSKSSLSLVYSGDFNFMNWNNDIVYIGTKTGLYTVDLKTHAQQKLNDLYIINLSVNENGIFFLNDKLILCKMEFDKTDVTYLSKGSVEQQRYFSNKTKYYYIKDGWLYYLTGDDNFMLYRVSLDGKTTQQLTDKTVGAVNFFGNTIYYTHMEYNRNLDIITMRYEKSVQSMKPDGSDKKLFYDFSGIKNVNPGFTFTDQYIIYSTTVTTPQKQMKCDLNGKSITQVAEPEIPVYSVYIPELITPDFRFYAKGNCIYCSNPDGSDETQISTVWGDYFKFHNGWLYFMKDFGLFRTRKGQMEEQLTTGLSFSKYTISSEKLIFIVNDAGHTIYTMNLDGTDLKSLVSEKNMYMIGVENGWVYYVIHDYTSNLHTINKIKVDGTGITTLVKTDNDNIIMTYPILVDGWLYGSNGQNPGRFSRVNCTTGEIQLLQKSVANDFISNGDYIYYTNNDRHIYRISKKDLSVKCMLPQPVNSFTIVNNQIYFVTPDIRNTTYHSYKIS